MDKVLHRPFHRATLVVVALVFVQILLGATVRATGSGMGCPDWPLCHGSFLPAMNFESILEYSHRAVAALVTVTLTGMGLWIAFSARLRAYVGRQAALTVVLLTTLIGFGAITVAYDMPPLVVATHLELAALLVVLWVTVSLRAREAFKGPGEAPQPGVYRVLVAIAFGAAFVQLFLGALVSVSHAALACPDFPTCYGIWLPPLIGNVGVQMLHRFGAYTVAVLVAITLVAVEFGAGARVRFWMRLAAMLVVVQIGLGIATVLMGVPPLLSVTHLGTGITLFTTLYLATYASFPFFWKPGDGDQPPVILAAPPVPGLASQQPLTPAFSLRERLSGFYELTKPSIVMLVVVTGLPAFMIASGSLLDWRVGLAALLGTALAAASAAVFNHYFERERDKVMLRTAKRPIPSGLVKPGEAVTFAILLGTAATVVLSVWTTWLATAIALGGLFFYGFFYTLVLKDSSPQNIVIGGAAGASAPLICWAAVTGDVGLPAWIMFAIIFFWTPPHFWALAIFKLDDYVAAKLPMYPVVYGVPATTRWIAIYTLMLVPLSLLLVPLRAAGPIYLVGALTLGLGFLWSAFKVLETQAKREAIRLFAYSIVYTLGLFAVLTLDAALGGHQLVAHIASIGR